MTDNNEQQDLSEAFLSSDVIDAFGKKVLGEDAYRTQEEVLRMVQEGRLAGAGFLQNFALVQGAAHIATAPLRGLDRAICNQKLIHCPSEEAPIVPKETPAVVKDPVYGRRFDVNS